MGLNNILKKYFNIADQVKDITIKLTNTVNQYSELLDKHEEIHRETLGKWENAKKGLESQEYGGINYKK